MIAGVSIRAGEGGDLPAVHAVIESAYRHYVARIGRRPAPMTADYALAIEQLTVWVAEITPPVASDHAVRMGEPRTDVPGAVCGVLVLQPAADHLHLDTIAVLPGRQGIGIGCALLHYAESTARSLGLSEVRLYTNVAMVENLSYYPKRGYVEVDRRRESGFDRVYFVKSVRS